MTLVVPTASANYAKVKAALKALLGLAILTAWPQPAAAAVTTATQQQSAAAISSATLGQQAVANTTVTTTLRHLNKDNFDQITVSDIENFSFIVLGGNEGDNPIFEEVLKEANEENGPIFALHTGNMVQSGQESQYETVLAQLRKNLQLPVLTALGRHDLSPTSGNGLYRAIFGRPYYSFRLGNTGFYVVDNSTPEAFNDKQCQWLEKELHNGDHLHYRIAVLPTPLYDPRPDGNLGMKPEQAKQLLDILKRGAVSVIIAGGVNGMFTGEWDEIRYIITGGAGGPLAGDTVMGSQYYQYHYLLFEVSTANWHFSMRKIKLPATPSAAPSADKKTP